MNEQRKAAPARGSAKARTAGGPPTAVQPHGLFFVLDAATLAITHVSANADALLGTPAERIVGGAIADYLDAGFVRDLAAFGAAPGGGAGPFGRVVLQGVPATHGWRAASHRQGGLITLEVAPVPADSPDLERFVFEATAALRAVRDNAGIEATATTVSRRLREMTGYERVMVVRFDAAGHGAVIAESKAPSAGAPLLGIPFQTDEIPAWARAVALQRPVRMINDVAAAPVPLVPPVAADAPMDLSETILRAPPPAQVQLLAGLGARAALMMSLVQDRRLWGLIVFLHRAPRRLSLPQRSALQLMTDAIAVRFAAAENQENERELARRRRTLAAIRDAFGRAGGESVAAILRRHGRPLLRALGASGALCHLPEGDVALGHVPADEAARRIAAVCRLRGASGMFASDHVAGLDPELAKVSKVAAGALFLALPRSRGWLLFLRAEAPPPRLTDMHPDRRIRDRLAARTAARANYATAWSAADLSIAPEIGALVDDLAPLLAERRNMNRVLQNEAKLRAILDATQDGLVVIDRAGTILEFSPGAERLLQYRASEVVGRNVDMLMPEDLRQRHRESLARAAHAIQPRVMGADGKLLALRRDGTTFPFELTLTSLAVGGDTLFIGALRDTTEQLSAAQRDRFWFEHSSVGYSVSDPVTDRRLRVNPSLCRILGYSERELLSMSVLATIHPDDAEVGKQWREAVRNGSDEPFRHLHRLIRKDGKIVWGRVTASPIRAADSSIAQIVSEVIDVTELVEADAKLRTALTRAEAASAAKSQFLATMSHELRTPLNAIIGLSEMMTSEIMGPIGNARYADYVGDIHRAGRHLLDLVTDVLDSSRIEAGGYRLSLVPLQTEDVIEETRRIVAPLAAERGVRLERKIAADLPPIFGDRRALKQILINVVSNAVKYTPKGGSIAIRAEAEPAAVTIAVADTGAGIRPEDLPRVTEPFYRAGDVYTRNAAGGAGLGLSIASGLVAAHGGSLAIASTFGEGTTVTLRFPVSAPAPRKASAAATP